MAARVEDDTLKVGLLMEAAQAHQSVAATALEQLRAHTTGLDAVVREEIRSTLIEELHALNADTQRAAEALRALHRSANLRLVAWSAAIATLASLIPVAAAWYTLPSSAEMTALKARRDELTANVERLSRQGGQVELRHCGAAQRLCVRIERKAPSYGAGADFLVVKGY